jgi:hypothetical protein
MKKLVRFFVSAALLFGAAYVAMAQEANVSEKTEKEVSEDVENPRRFEVGSFRDNWFIGIGGGVNFYMGEHDRQMKFINRLAPAMDVYAGNGLHRYSVSVSHTAAVTHTALQTWYLASSTQQAVLSRMTT